MEETRKKDYMSPALRVFNITSESIICASIEEASAEKKEYETEEW